MENHEQSDEEFIGQFATLSAGGARAVTAVHVPQHAIRKRTWSRCILVWVITSKVIKETIFSELMTNVWAIKPVDGIEAVGSNMFVVELKSGGKVIRTLSKGLWNFRGDMMVVRRAYGPVDLTEPKITHFECWVELHGIPSDFLNLEGVQILMNQIGNPMSNILNSFHDGKKLYKQKLRVGIETKLIDRVAIGNAVVQVVYDGVTSVCLFCAKIGHDNMTCPVRFRAVRMHQEGKLKKVVGEGEISLAMYGKWINSRAFLHEIIELDQGLEGEQSTDRETSQTSKDQEKKHGTRSNTLKRSMDLNTALTITDGSDISHSKNDRRLNCKRVRETIPNSSPKQI